MEGGVNRKPDLIFCSPEEEIEILNGEVVRLKGQQALIPFIIRALHPGITQQNYDEFLKDPNFLKRTAYVCEDCYLYISLSSRGSGVNIKIGKKYEFVGQRGLLPMKSKNKQKISEDYEKKVHRRFNSDYFSNSSLPNKVPS